MPRSNASLDSLVSVYMHPRDILVKIFDAFFRVLKAYRTQRSMKGPALCVLSVRLQSFPFVVRCSGDVVRHARPGGHHPRNQ